MLEYKLELVETRAATGYFACRPAVEIPFDEGLDRLRRCPNDEFLRQDLLAKISAWDTGQLRRRLQGAPPDDRFLQALLYEACLLYPKFRDLTARFGPQAAAELAPHSPLVVVRAGLRKDGDLHARWVRRLAANIGAHEPLAPLNEIGLPPPFPTAAAREADRRAVALPRVIERTDGPLPTPQPRPAAADTFRTAMARLRHAGIAAGPEMRHVASLSPVALQRAWDLERTVHNGRHRYRLSGRQTAYGRGFSLEDARAAYAMEMVERVSSFAAFDADGVVGYRFIGRLKRARYSELPADEGRPLNPAQLPLAAPYEDQPLHWVAGRRRTAAGLEPAWVPAQCVFLFCNLDEVKLFSGLGSTGLASGNSPDEARVSALLEVIERDSEAVTPFDPALCFEAESADPALAALLGSYRAAGVHVQFQDLTTAMGLPCCKSFVVSADGRIAKGTGASLTARRALLSALTETPYPFPHGPPSAPGMAGLLRVPIEDLPDYASGSVPGDLRRIEELLLANNLEPVYVDLTREDVDLPVVRAWVPGLEITADFDRFSRVSPRLFAAYLRRQERGSKDKEP